MQVSLIITILGPDKPGLVESLSETLTKYGASWSESRMAHLAGKFAGLLQVSLPTENLEPLTKAVRELETDSFKIHLEKADTNIAKPEKILKLELLGQDRPGIIFDITQQLAKLNVNIEELESHIREASMSGEILFCAELTLGLPENVSSDEVQDSLEEIYGASMKPLFQTKLGTSVTASLLAVFSLFFSSELLANGCSKADIEYYLQKGFSHEQVTKLCSIPLASAPAQGQVSAQRKAPQGADQAFLAAALDAKNVTLNQNSLSYSSEECAEYGPENNVDLIEEACVNSTCNLKRDYLNLGSVRRQDKTEVLRLLPTNPKQVNIPIRRGIDP
ncbi:hypothetical protein GQR58_020418 [Nymphon striatum]|nr:hypothetical protein GQR58_020418 [Nymphon striatum]